MASNSKIKPILEHIAWLENALRDSDTPETPYRKALLALNAATLLDWHFTLPSQNPRKPLAKPSARKKLQKLIASFTDATRNGVSKTEYLTNSNAEKPLGTLADATAGFLKQVTELWGIEITPRREPEFEKPLKPAELISQWLEGNKPTKAGRAAKASQKSQWVPESPEDLERVECIYAQLSAWAAQKLFDEGKLPAEGYAAARKASATFLEEVLEVVIEGAKGAERRRWRALGRPVIESLRKPVAARTRKAGA
jgi:hypothetical protein